MDNATLSKIAMHSVFGLAKNPKKHYLSWPQLWEPCKYIIGINERNKEDEFKTRCTNILDTCWNSTMSSDIYIYDVSSVPQTNA